MVLTTSYRSEYDNEKNRKIPICAASIAVSHRQEAIYRPDGMGVYQYFFCLEGEGEVIIAGEKVVIKPGMGFIIEKGISHSYKELLPNWKLALIGIDGTLCKEILKVLRIEKSGPFICTNMEMLLEKLRKIYRMVSKREVMDLPELSKQSYNFLMDLSANINRVVYNEKVEDNELIHKIVQFLEQHYGEPITIQDIAEYVELSREYICTYFKKQTNQTIMNVLLKIRLVHARLYLIQYPSKKIYEIAQMCGFESASYFCYVFRKKMGMSPDKYRKQNL